MMQAKPKLPPKPKPPVPGECCGRGCESCVHVYYQEALEKWQAAADELKAAERKDENRLEEV